MSKARTYVYTLNNYTAEEEQAYQAIPCKYHLYGREVGESGTPHLQGLIQFPSPRSFTSVTKALTRAHVEVCKDLAASLVYCKKDGDFWQEGILPKNGAPSIQDRAARNKRLLEEDLDLLVSTGELSANQVPVIKKARIIMAQEKCVAFTAPDTRGIWLWGPPGTGKSHQARLDFPDIYVKAQNKWFDGYIGQKTIVLDDFDKQGVCLGHYLKIWTDKWSCNGEIKGSTVALQHEQFVVTSNYHPDDLWCDDINMLAAIKRRFKITHFSELNKN